MEKTHTLVDLIQRGNLTSFQIEELEDYSGEILEQLFDIISCVSCGSLFHSQESPTPYSLCPSCLDADSDYRESAGTPYGYHGVNLSDFY